MANHIFDLNRPELRVEKFESLDERALRQFANECFERADGAGQNPLATTWLLRAQFFLSEIARREHVRERKDDETTARRDHKMEWVVIILIGLEIVIGVGGIVFGITEGNKQVIVLNQMKESMGAIASTSTAQAAKLGDLTGQEKTSLDSLSKMNQHLQDSVGKTSEMAAALSEQLKILRSEQTAREAELVKHPEMHAEVGGLRIDSLGQALKAKELSDEKAVFEIVVRNVGTLALINGLVRIAVDNNNIKISAPTSSPLMMPTDLAKTGNGIVFPLARLSRTVWQLITVTVEYPKGTGPFEIMLTVDGDNLSLTPLGGIHVVPPNTPNQ